MKKKDRKFWNSIYFRFICLAMILITGINYIATFYFKQAELLEAEKMLLKQLIKQSEIIIELKQETGDDYKKYIRFLSDDIVKITQGTYSDYQQITNKDSYRVLYDDHIEHYHLTIGMDEVTLNFYAVLTLDDTLYLIEPNMNYTTIEQISARIRRYLETTLFICILIFLVLTVYIAKKIKRVTMAAKLVSSGRFDVELEENGRDEIDELAKSFNYMVKELNKNEYLHKEFISSVSHEFKTPITSLKGYAILAKSQEVTERQREEYLDIIINESNRLSKLSSNLLRISELNNKSTLKHQKWFSLDEQIRDIIILLQPIWEEKEIEFDIDMEEVSFYGDQGILWHLFNNLITNAVRYSHDGGVIKVLLETNKMNRQTASLVSNKKGLLFCVQDNGIGIAKEEKEKIFEQFYTVDKSRNHEGNGLGLAIVKKIVDLYSGTIRLESELGIGSRFFVEFDSLYIYQAPSFAAEPVE